MGIFKKIKKISKTMPEASYDGTVLSLEQTKEMINKSLDRLKDNPKLSMAVFDELQNSLLNDTKKATEKIVSDAKTEIDKTILVAIDEMRHQENIFVIRIFERICVFLMESKNPFKRWLGWLIYNNKVNILK